MKKNKRKRTQKKTKTKTPQFGENLSLMMLSYYKQQFYLEVPEANARYHFRRTSLSYSSCSN